ncbi:hypothetical protein LshimejAT787_0500500 [Lyophyllum shimeji]|uniref:Uncharacterized protein n=1 Tax=Lyophyllum shimeji TaxID=47721 RepID=A0A9P3UNS0_LYOSH|nr:hypothetical protein LshimejAT787_0500500 [Lyophyllum shimeji]
MYVACGWCGQKLQQRSVNFESSLTFDNVSRILEPVVSSGRVPLGPPRSVHLCSHGFMPEYIWHSRSSQSTSVKPSAFYGGSLALRLLTQRVVRHDIYDHGPRRVTSPSRGRRAPFKHYLRFQVGSFRLVILLLRDSDRHHVHATSSTVDH